MANPSAPGGGPSRSPATTVQAPDQIYTMLRQQGYPHGAILNLIAHRTQQARAVVRSGQQHRTGADEGDKDNNADDSDDMDGDEGGDGARAHAQRAGHEVTAATSNGVGQTQQGPATVSGWGSTVATVGSDGTPGRGGAVYQPTPTTSTFPQGSNPTHGTLPHLQGGNYVGGDIHVYYGAPRTALVNSDLRLDDPQQKPGRHVYKQANAASIIEQVFSASPFGDIFVPGAHPQNNANAPRGDEGFEGMFRMNQQVSLRAGGASDPLYIVARAQDEHGIYYKVRNAVSGRTSCYRSNDLQIRHK
ncbi:hypothetical protein LTR85_010897 [Meristemomyces frigidus]|nr:hypothetical protein LTR85_010897 [Meristemomyces frigidus]